MDLDQQGRTFEVIIQHHPARSKYVTDVLLPALPGSSLSIDTENLGPWFSYKQALQRVTADHTLIIQDDVYPCLDLCEGVRKAVDFRPSEVFSIYKGISPTHVRFREGHPVHVAYQQGLSWCSVDFFSAQGVVWPLHHARSFLAWIKKFERDPTYFKSPPGYADDVRFHTYLKAHRLKRWVTVPSLVEHVGIYQSLHKAGQRSTSQAVVYIGANNSALDVDWSLT